MSILHQYYYYWQYGLDTSWCIYTLLITKLKHNKITLQMLIYYMQIFSRKLWCFIYDTDLARGHAPATTWRPARLEWTRSLWHWPCSWSCTSDDMTARTVGMNKKSMTLTLLVVMHQWRHDGPHGWNEQEVYDTDLARGHAPATTWRPARLEWTRSLWHWPCSWSCTSDDMTARMVGMNKKSMTLTLLVVMHQRRHDGPHGWNE